MTPEATLLDANVLLALVAEQHQHHAAAHRWFATVGPWATTPLTEAALVRLMMNPAVAGGVVRGAVALDILTRLRQQGEHRFLTDGTSLASSRIDATALVGHRQVTDFHLVTLAAASHGVLATFDAKLRASLAPADRHYVELVPA